MSSLERNKLTVDPLGRFLVERLLKTPFQCHLRNLLIDSLSKGEWSNRNWKMFDGSATESMLDNNDGDDITGDRVRCGTGSKRTDRCVLAGRRRRSSRVMQWCWTVCDTCRIIRLSVIINNFYVTDIWKISCRQHDDYEKDSLLLCCHVAECDGIIEETRSWNWGHEMTSTRLVVLQSASRRCEQTECQNSEGIFFFKQM